MTEHEIITELCKYFHIKFPNIISDKKSLYNAEINLLAMIMDMASKIANKLLEEVGNGYSGNQISLNDSVYKFKDYQNASIHGLFGKMKFKRARYVPLDRGSEIKTHYPLNEQLGIADRHTPACLYFIAQFMGNDVYNEGVKRFNEIFRPTGIDAISTKKAQDMTNDYGLLLESIQKSDTKTVMEGASIPLLDPLKEMAVFIDATKTPEVTTVIDEKGNKKRPVAYRDAKIASVAAYQRDYKTKIVEIDKITHVAAVENADLFEQRVIKEMHKRGKSLLEKPVIFVADGAPWIWDRVKNMAENRVEILDFYHATEHLSRISKKVFGENEIGKKWYSSWRENIFNGKIQELIHELESLYKKNKGEKRKEIIREKKYFESHSDRMIYPVYIEKGFPIGSGTVESACKNVVNCRMKRSGMKWSITGTTAMLQIRTSIKSNHFKLDFEAAVLPCAA